ncbi:tetratricopeptide repeat protein [Luteirhabdus pelagi]|uniref:tetratricopeptide repeat protein n=1 Tax=Luteirhabdus pelagi TaxID=2792783 RepID=UPI001939BE0F|nr:tetratricopeptide repeat protein [Luteirhabdus pelagi]
MKQKATNIRLLSIGILFSVTTLFAQTPEEQPTDDLGNVSDAFQENFFEALKQKGIENYELALTALRKAEKAADGDSELEAVVAFERGKNLTELKQYEEAEASFQSVLDKEGERLDVLEAMYDLYYLESDYDKAIPLVQKLMEFDDDYKEDLANLYARNEQYEKALQVLDELDETWGESDYRNALRTQIYRTTGNEEGAIQQLEERLAENPKSEQDYLNLIYMYSEQGNSEKAFQTAKELLVNRPGSKQVHVSLYKFYLAENNIEKALSSMETVFSAESIPTPQKHKVLGDFIEFVNANPEYQPQLEKAVTYFDTEEDGKIFEQLGDFYVSQNKKEKALPFYQQGLERDADNFSLLKNTILLLIDFEKYEEAEAKSSEGLDIFPAQPLLYLLNGVSNIGLNNPDAAISKLEEGLSYLFDDPKMERDFYQQLSEAYTLKGDSNKATEFKNKAQNLTISN